jgi:hypothetical protein
MSSAIANPTNVVEYVRSLSDEDKEAAFSELVDEVIRSHGPYTISITKPNGERIGYLVPEAAAESQLKVRIPELTEEQRERTRRALANLNDTFVVEEYFEQLSREDRD